MLNLFMICNIVANKNLVKNICEKYEKIPSIWNSEILAYFDFNGNIEMDILENKKTSINHLFFIQQSIIVIFHPKERIISDNLIINNIDLKNEMNISTLMKLIEFLNNNGSLMSVIRTINDLQVVFPITVNGIDYMCVIKNKYYNLMPIQPISYQINEYIENTSIQIQCGNNKYAMILQYQKHNLKECKIFKDFDLEKDIPKFTVILLKLDSNNIIKRVLFKNFICC